jgi:hypothetical protein
MLKVHQDKLLILLLNLFFFVGCNTKQDEKTLTVNLSEQKKYNITEEHTSILLLKSFILDKACEDAKNRIYANTFLCSVFSTGDTILVLNICEKAFDFLQSNYTLKSENDLIIDSSKVSREYPRIIITNIDSSTYHKHYPFVVADITKLVY